MTARRIRSRAPLPLAVALVAACHAAGSPAWEVRTDGLSPAIDALFSGYDDPASPGGIVAIQHRGAVVHLDGYGSANREFGIPWTPDTRYRIASISKGVTGYAALRLQDRGLIDLDEPVGTYLTDFPALSPQPTLRQLLTMTSGLWYDEWLLPLADVRGSATLDEMYALNARQDRLNYRPGTAYDYVDTNYRVFARVVSTVMSMPFHEAMAELVYDPLGMASTLNPPDFRQVFDGQGQTYLRWGSAVVPYRFEFPYESSGDGSLITTIHDLLTWIQALSSPRGGEPSELDRMVPQDTLESGRPIPYGLGIRPINHRGLRGWGHGGATGTFWATFPDHELTIALFTNYLGPISPVAVLMGVMDAVIDSTRMAIPAGGSRYLEPSEIPPARRPALEGVFVHAPTGLFIESQPQGDQLAHSFAGTTLFLEPAGECLFRSGPYVHWPALEVRPTECGGSTGDLMVAHADWTGERRFVRVRSGSVPRPAPDLVGGYVATRLETRWRVVRDGPDLGLRIGAGAVSGQQLRLEPVGTDLFIARPEPPSGVDYLALPSMGVRFARDPQGRVARMTVASNRIRNLEFVPEGR